jgi:hypothetical protein
LPTIHLYPEPRSFVPYRFQLPLLKHNASL